ncbi:MAG TPA: hypothetical protein VGK48_02960 [Terriglobia bacterium]|jgi:hypothetical protein
MLFILFRAANAVFAVVVAILISTRFGESAAGKLLTVGITTGVVALFEWLLIWLPKHSTRARRFLDPRSLFAGVWIQDVKRVHGSEGVKLEFPNRFAVFTIRYSSEADNYKVEGTAYTPSGEEHARWDSTEVVHFAKDGRSMTYEWSGSITDPAIGAEDPLRKGFAYLELPSDKGGRGRVDHVALNVVLMFNLSRVTSEWLAANQLSEFKPAELYSPEDRDRFAKAFVKSFAIQQ